MWKAVDMLERANYGAASNSGWLERRTNVGWWDPLREAITFALAHGVWRVWTGLDGTKTIFSSQSTGNNYIWGVTMKSWNRLEHVYYVSVVRFPSSSWVAVFYFCWGPIAQCMLGMSLLKYLQNRTQYRFHYLGSCLVFVSNVFPAWITSLFTEFGSE